MDVDAYGEAKRALKRARRRIQKVAFENDLQGEYKKMRVCCAFELLSKVPSEKNGCGKIAENNEHCYRISSNIRKDNMLSKFPLCPSSGSTSLLILIFRLVGDVSRFRNNLIINLRRIFR